MSFKNIKVPVGKTGKTRLQRVKVLKSGKFKFVKNLKKGGATQTKTKRSTTKRRTGTVRNTVKGKMFRTLSGVGALEDVAWGFIGFTILGKTPTALPFTRALQGIQGHAFDRRGRARLVPAILDLASLWLAGGFGNGNGFRLGNGGFQTESIVNLLKLRPL